MSTGILVTKGSKEADFGHLLINQLFGMPKTLYLVGGVVAGLGIFSPLPTLLYVTFGAGFILLGRITSQTIEEVAVESEVATPEEQQAEEIRQPENVTSLLQVDPIELEFGYGIIPLADGVEFYSK